MNSAFHRVLFMRDVTTGNAPRGRFISHKKIHLLPWKFDRPVLNFINSILLSQLLVITVLTQTFHKNLNQHIPMQTSSVGVC